MNPSPHINDQTAAVPLTFAERSAGLPSQWVCESKGDNGL